MAPATTQINYIAYLLVFVGYMSLTISLPLIGMHLSSLPASASQLKYAISILFFMFSISAISLSRIADMVGSYRVLVFAQLVSICGLLIAATAHHDWLLFVGLFLVGAGTGCYSSIARSLIAQYAANHYSMQRAFSFFSILLIIAPLVSTFLMIYISTINWRLAYLAMAAIEIFIYWQVIRVLRLIPTKQQKITLKNILYGYGYCLRRPYFTLNMLTVGLTVTVIVSTFLGLSHRFFLEDLKVSDTIYPVANILISLIYIIGIICFRLLPKNYSFESIRICALTVFVAAVLGFYFSTSFYLLALSMYTACFSLGLIIPLSTSSGLYVIKQHHGAAAALYTFAFALISAIWSAAYNHIQTSTENYLFIVMVTTAILLILINILTPLTRPKI